MYTPVYGNSALHRHSKDTLLPLRQGKGYQFVCFPSVSSAICLGWLQRRHQISASLALCAGNPLVANEFPSQRANTAGSVSMQCRHPAAFATFIGLSAGSKENAVDFYSETIRPLLKRYTSTHSPLQWHHMRVSAYQITDSSFCSTSCLG